MIQTIGLIVAVYAMARFVQVPFGTATALHCLGLDPHAELRDALNRRIPVSRGDAIRAILLPTRG